MKKILTILMIICYSYTLFSQNSMNDIQKLEQKIDSVDNLIESLDSINYPVPVFEDKLSQLEKEQKCAIQEYYAINNFKPSIYKTDRNIAIKAFSIVSLCLGPITGAILLSNDDYKYTHKNKCAIAGSCFIGIPITAVSAIIISNSRYHKSQKNWKNYRKRLNSKNAEINLLEDRIEEEKVNIKVLRANEYRTRKSNLQKEHDYLISELGEALVKNGYIVYDTITEVKNNYLDYNSNYLYSNILIPEKYFLIELDTIETSYGSLNYSNYTQDCYIKIKKNIKLKKGRYFYTTADTLQTREVNKFGNYYDINIPIKFKYDINYNGSEYEITMKTYKNNKLIDISYFNSLSDSSLREIDIKYDILIGKFEETSNTYDNTYNTYVGPRGGVYHYSKSGKKVYHKRK